MKEAKLVISRPFIPTLESNELDCFYYFVDMQYFDKVSVIEVCKAYAAVYIEQTVYEKIRDFEHLIQSSIIVISDIVNKRNGEFEKVKVAFLASNDTHVHFMKQLSDKFERHIYLIPSLSCKDEGASNALRNMGENYIEIDYKAKECRELLEFNPKCIFCGADWTSEYFAVSRVIQKSSIRIIALQEGPEDWHFRIVRENVFKVLKHYRNADIIFAEGAKTLNYIRPKYFAVTGNPKISRLDIMPLPAKPRVLINCNFTYLETKPAYETARTKWMESVLKVCKKIGVDYVISIHPRDTSEWHGEPSVRSNAFVLKEELIKSSIVISRFSSVSYEALASGRQSVYYNVHMEPMATFQDEKNSPILCVREEAELEELLKKHISEYPGNLDREKLSYFLNRHVSKLDGKSIYRIINSISEISENFVQLSEKLIQKIEKQNTIEKHDDEWFRNIKNNVMVILSNENDGSNDKGLTYAEQLSDKGKHVLLILPYYSDRFSRYMMYQNHQCIEVIPTKDYQIDLNGINVSNIYVTEDLYNSAEIINNIKSSRGTEYAEWSVIH